MSLANERVGIAIGVDLEHKRNLDIANRDFKRSAGNIGGFYKTAGVVAVAGLAATTAAIYSVINASNELNTSLAEQSTLLGGTNEEAIARTRGLGREYQMLSMKLGKSTDDLAAAGYEIISAFGDSAETAKLLEISSKAATAGVATTQESVKLLSAVTKGYGDTSAEAMQKAADLAFTTVKLGQTTFPELAASMGDVVSTADTLGVTQEELFAGYATLTGVTGDTSKVSTQLKAILGGMIKPTKDMAALTRDLGYANTETMVRELGYVGALKKLIANTDGSTESVGKLMESKEALGAIFALTGAQADTFTAKHMAMADASGATQRAYELQTEGLTAAKYEAAKFTATFNTILEQVGDFITQNPAFIGGIKGMTEALRTLGIMMGLDLKTDEEKFDALNRKILQTTSAMNLLAAQIRDGVKFDADYDPVTNFLKFGKVLDADTQKVYKLVQGMEGFQTVLKGINKEKGDKDDGSGSLLDPKKYEKAQTAIDNVIDANARFGASKEHLMALDIAAFQQGEYSREQLYEFIDVKQTLLDKELQLAAAKEEARVKEEEQRALDETRAAPGLMGAEGGEEPLQDALGPTVFGMNTRLEEMAIFHDKELQMMIDRGDSSTAIAAQVAKAEIDIVNQQEQMKIQIRRQGLGMTAGLMGNLLMMTGNNNKKMFKMYQAFSIGQAVVSGYHSAVLAWQSGMATGGPWAPLFAVAYTAMSLARTGALISSIKSQKMGGGGGGGSGSGGGGVPITGFSGNNQPIPQRFSQSTQPGMNQNITVYLQSETGEIPQETIDKLMDGFNRAADERNVTLNRTVIEGSA